MLLNHNSAYSTSTHLILFLFDRSDKSLLVMFARICCNTLWSPVFRGCDLDSSTALGLHLILNSYFWDSRCSTNPMTFSAVYFMEFWYDEHCTILHVFPLPYNCSRQLDMYVGCYCIFVSEYPHCWTDMCYFFILCKLLICYPF